MDWGQIGILAAIGAFGGAFGAMLGVGGGILVVPLLTLVLKVPVKQAIACSLVAVAGTACFAAANYIRLGFTNLRLALVLELGTVAGAIVGALIASALNARVLAGLFGAVLIYTCFSMFRRWRRGAGTASNEPAGGAGEASGSSLCGDFQDGASGTRVRYEVRKVGVGLGTSGFAGVISGLLGIGGGVVNVPVMNLVMGVPMKAAVGTSSFVIGATAVASSFVYYEKGLMDPMLAAPVLVGVFGGSFAGTRLVQHVRSQVLQAVFAGVALAAAVLMVLRASGVYI